MSTEGKSYVGGNAGNNDVRATNNPAGTVMNTGAGNDVLRGGKGDDVMTGGAGDDLMFGGNGADQFRFFGNQIGGSSDLDKIFDLSFEEGDTLVFGDYAGSTFGDTDGVNAFANGGSASISSIEGLYAAVQSSGAITASQKGNTDVLILEIDNGNGQTQIIHLSGLWDDYAALFGA